MTDDVVTSHEPWDEAVSAYALDALDAREEAAFETHLAACPRCQANLVDARRITASLGLGVDVDAVTLPATLKARTLARATAQPRVASRTAVTPPAVAPRPSAWAWLSAAAALLVAAGLGWYALSLQSQVSQLRGRVAEEAARADATSDELGRARRDVTRLADLVGVLEAPDLVRVDLRGQPGAPTATGRAFVSRSAGIVFRADRLPVLGAGRVYQLWVIPPGAGASPVSAGVLARDASDAYFLAGALPATVPSVRTVAVTDEAGPAGSPGPTTAILLVGTLAE